jgi:RHS repeat-associated protein
MSYDGLTGNLVASISDVGGSPHFNARRSFAYNSQVISATDPLGSITQYGYDSFGNQTSIVRDAGAGRLNQVTAISYNAAGDAVSITDPRGNTTTSSYDAARRPITTTAPNGLITSFSYDPDGRIILTKQSTGGTPLRSTAATYTLTGKPATATDANNNRTSFSYDRLDRVSNVTDAMFRVTNYGYDTLSRQTAISNLAIQSSPLLQKSYTPDGLLASITDANNHSTSFAYDRFDRPATTTYPLGSTEVLGYDADSNVTSRQTRAGDTIGFAYDTLNRLKTKTPPAPATPVNYSYDLNNRLTSVSDGSAAIAAAVPPSGPSVQYATNAAYDTVNRPTSITWNPASTAAAPSASSVTFAHTYNKANQRIGQTATDNSWFNYPAPTPSTVSYTADALNRYTAVGAVSPTYDGNSNLTSDGTFAFGYDAENRLTSAVGAGNTASYAYDAQGRRKTKTVNGTTTVFVTDAGNREVLEYDGASGAIQRWYAYGPGSNDVLNQANVVAGTRAALIPDIQGSVIASLDSSSGALSKIGYLPYGKSAGVTAPFGYTGQRIDPETNGLYYYRARQYSPAWGRFWQTDPIGYSGGSYLYAYVNNDPLNLIDPDGLFFAAVGAYLAQTTAPELTQSQNLTDFVQQYPRAAMTEGAFGLAIPFAIAGAGAAGLIGGAAGPEATLALARQIADAAVAPMNNLRTISLLETAEGPILVAGGTSALSGAQVTLAERLGLTVVETEGRHAEMAAITGATRLGLTPTSGVSTNIICPQCAAAIQQQLGGILTGARTFLFGP